MPEPRGGRPGTVYVFTALLVALYTGNYALEVWRAGNRFGSLALFLLAVLAFAFPVWVFLVRP